MEPGQWRVLVLILVLLGLEAIANPTVRGFFSPFISIVQRGGS